MRFLLLLVLACSRLVAGYDVLVQAAIEPELRPLLEALARATSALRTADWNFDATGESDGD